MASVELSPVKRERQRKQAKRAILENMRESLPILTEDEIRRFRLPYIEALFIELKQLGLVNTTEFLQQLIQFQDDLRKEHGPDSVVSARPLLTESRKQLYLLFENLKQAEYAHYTNNIERECDRLIEIAIYFAMGSKDWWWLGEQLLIQAVNCSRNFERDGGRRRAITKYIYGKFLWENIERATEAKEYLIEAREFCIGKSWTAKKEIGDGETVFIRCCLLLHKILLMEAEELMGYDPLKAAGICAIARKRAAEACDKKGEANAFMTRGTCEMEAEDYHAAIKSFHRALTLHAKNEDTEGICETRIHLATAYLKVEKHTESLNNLETVLAFAEIHKLPRYIAQAYRMLGDYYLNRGLPNLATPLLIKALDIFHELNDLLNREQVRNLAAISVGQELMPRYVELILRCDRKHLKGFQSLLALVEWKDSRKSFWSGDDEISSSSSLRSNEEPSMVSETGMEHPGEHGCSDTMFIQQWKKQEVHGEWFPEDIVRHVQPEVETVCSEFGETN